GSLAGLETLLRDVAAALEALWESPGVGRGRRRRDAVGPLGSVAVVVSEDRGVADRCAIECRCSPRSLAAASDPGVRRAGAGRPAAGESRATAGARPRPRGSAPRGARRGGGGGPRGGGGGRGDFDWGGAYRKAMGLTLGEGSSGTYQGRLRISKRGSARTRQWLYFAVLRLVQQCGVRPWYEAKKARHEGEA